MANILAGWYFYFYFFEWISFEHVLTHSFFWQTIKGDTPEGHTSTSTGEKDPLLQDDEDWWDTHKQLVLCGLWRPTSFENLSHGAQYILKLAQKISFAVFYCTVYETLSRRPVFTLFSACVQAAGVETVLSLQAERVEMFCHWKPLFCI